MNPVRVTAPDEWVVPLDDLKQHLRVSGDDSDLIITQLQNAAVSTLEGWRGILGRCILPQTWKVFFARSGTYHLPFPDVIEVQGGEWNAAGRYVTVEDGTEITFTCALPDDAMPAVKQAITIWVAMRYDALSGPEFAAHQAAFDAIISPIRWGGI